MTASKKHRIEDLMEQIEQADKMILFNANNPSKLSTEQYEDLKKRFFSELIEELLNISTLSKYSFKLVHLAINKYYPELINNKAIEDKEDPIIKTASRDFKVLAAALVA